MISYPSRSAGVEERGAVCAEDADDAEVLVTGLIMAGMAGRVNPVLWFM